MAKTLQEDLLEISVDHINVSPKDYNRKFGFLSTDCYIDLTCSPVKIRLEESFSNVENGLSGPLLSTDYRWWLDEGDTEVQTVELSNVYLDSPHDDLKILKRLGEAYCILAYKNVVVYGTQLICLLVQRVPPDNSEGGAPFRRFGIAMIPGFAKGKGQDKLWSFTKRKQQIRLI